MIFRLLVFFFFISIKYSYSNIIYDKNDIFITEIEVNRYMSLYINNFDSNISKNEVIKNIVLIKKTINFLQKNNPNFLLSLDNIIKKEFSNEIINDQETLNFIRFQKIRNEFISDYYNNTFDTKDLEIVFSKFTNFRVPLSKNNCLTINKLHEVSNDKLFIKNLFDNFKKKQQNFETKINNEIYNVCINTELFSKLEKEVFIYIENKTKKNFNDFIYGKAN